MLVKTSRVIPFLNQSAIFVGNTSRQGTPANVGINLLTSRLTGQRTYTPIQ